MLKKKKRNGYLLSDLCLITLSQPTDLHQQLSSANVAVCWLAESKNDFNDLERKRPGGKKAVHNWSLCTET